MASGTSAGRCTQSVTRKLDQMKLNTAISVSKCPKRKEWLKGMDSQSLSQRSSIVMDVGPQDEAQKHDEVILTAGDYGHSPRNSQQALNQCGHEPQRTMHLIDTNYNPFENSREQEQFPDPEIDDIIEDVINNEPPILMKCSEKEGSKSNHQQSISSAMEQDTTRPHIRTEPARPNYWE